MKSGIYLSEDSQPTIINQLKTSFHLDCVRSVDELQNSFFKSEYDFVYVDLASTEEALKTIHTTYKLDPDILLLTHREYALPQIDNLYEVSLERLVPSMIEVLSFHEAKLNGELQVDYRSSLANKPSYFFIAENSSQGLILADAGDGIFYMNEAARNLLNQDDGKRLMRQYLKLEKSLESSAQGDDRERKGVSFFDFVRVIDSDLYLRVMKKSIVDSEGVEAGFVYYLEDVTDEFMTAQKLKDERGKYSSLTSRLNEVLLKDLGSNAYNLSYLKRKIDLEIKHARRLQSDVRMIYIGIKDFDAKVSALSLKKTIQTKSTQYLTQRFPEPNVVGCLQWGHWLIILQGNIQDVPNSFRNFSQQMSDFLYEEISVVRVEIGFMEFADLKKYNSSQDLLKVLPL